MDYQQPANGQLAGHARADCGRVEAPASSPRTLWTNVMQYCLSGLVILAFLGSAVCLHVQQWLGAPLYLVNRRWYYAWQAIVKESTALLILVLNQIRAPTTARISGDDSVMGQIRGSEKLLFEFPDRIVLIANHQIYTDWIFFWWTAYNAGQHGHLFVILKDSIKKIPVIGAGLTFFSWIFLSRRWETDQVQLQEGINSLADSRTRHPMWLLLFPEGTNMSRNARKASEKWSSKSGIPDLKHVLLPRSRGLQFCLQRLSSSVQWMYDCTIAYEGIPPGQYGQETHSLKRLYIDGIKAPPAHMYWRRFAIMDIPFEDTKAFEKWVLQRWIEKDELLERFQQSGCFPAHDGYVFADIKARTPVGYLQILGGPAAVVVVWWASKLVLSSLATLVSSFR